MIHMAISILSGNVIIKHQTQVVESRGNSLRSWFSSPSRDPPHALLALGATSSWASGGTPASFVGKWFCRNCRIHQKHCLLREMNYTPVQQVCIYSPCVLECQQLVHWWLIAIKPDSIFVPGCTRSAGFFSVGSVGYFWVISTGYFSWSVDHRWSS